MAKQKQNPSKPEKRGGLLGLFDSIKDFFHKLIEKIKLSREFNQRVQNGNKGIDSPEGQVAAHAEEIKKTFGYQTLDECREHQKHFPGFHEMQMAESGLVRIPKGVELIWQNDSTEAAATRYIQCIDDKFNDRPEPIQMHNSQAFTDIARDIGKAMKQNDTSLHQFVIGNTFITAQFDGDKCTFTLSDGKTTKRCDVQQYNDIANAITASYTAINSQENVVWYIDPQNNTKSICLHHNETEYDAYIARTVTGYTGIGDNQTRYDMPNVVQIAGPRALSPELVNAMIMPQEGQASSADIQTIATKAYKEAKANGEASSVFVAGNKMLWVTQHDEHFDVTIAAHHCEYNDVKPMVIPLTDKVFNPDTGALKSRSLYYAVEKGMQQLDKRIESAAIIAEQTRNMERHKHDTPDGETPNGTTDENNIDTDDITR